MAIRTEIGKILKNKLIHLDKNPSDSVWTKIETDLNKRKKRGFLFWLITSLLSIGIITSLVYVFQNNSDKKDSYESKKINTELLILDNQKNKSKETTANKKTKTIRLIKQSIKLIKSTTDYDEYEMVKTYRVLIKKNHTTTKNYKSSNLKIIKKNTLNNNAKSPQNKLSKNLKLTHYNKNKKITSSKSNTSKSVPKNRVEIKPNSNISNNERKTDSKLNRAVSKDNSEVSTTIKEADKDSIIKKANQKREYKKMII